MSRRFAVLGSPITHSKSPVLHTAAYRVLGHDWSYDRIELREAELAGWLAGPGREFAGCSVTMPLKHELARLASRRDEIVELTGVANTVVGLATGELQVANTDVDGIVRAIEHAGGRGFERATLLGAGATAASAVVALARLGVQSIEVHVREPQRAVGVVELAQRVGVQSRVRQIASIDLPAEPVDLLVSTLPAGALGERVHAYANTAGVVFDVAYDPWPSELVRAGDRWQVISGLEMLLQQALLQIRIFESGDVTVPLAAEDRVEAAMREALAAL